MALPLGDMMAVTQLIYSSRNKSVAQDRAQLTMLRTILTVSQRNNVRDGLTGFLIFDRVHFFQILEGDSDRVLATFNRIQRDPSHGEVTLMAKREVRARSFPQWSMGGALRSLDHQEIFLRHGIVDSLDPRKVDAATVHALALDLQNFEIDRKEVLKAGEAGVPCAGHEKGGRSRLVVR
jgi:hypothetical protein